MHIPPQLIVMDLVGMLLAVLGLAGMFADLSHLVPVFADRNAAGTVAGAGLVLLVSAVKIVGLLRRRQAQSMGSDSL